MCIVYSVSAFLSGVAMLDKYVCEFILVAMERANYNDLSRTTKRIDYGILW